jgi:hypothetical protein
MIAADPDRIEIGIPAHGTARLGAGKKRHGLIKRG